MPNDVTEVENELRSVLQDKRQVEEHMAEIQQLISSDETWLMINTPATSGYQETLEECLALQAYEAELCSQASSLDDVILELTLEQASWCNPDLLLAA